jgi:hypothetical protein
MTTATLALPRTHHPRFVESCLDFFAGIQDGLRIARRYHELEAMTADELAELGLTRKDIARAAVRSVD